MISKEFTSLRDNRKRGTVGDFISDNLSPDCSLSFVSAYFTIYAYLQLKNKLDAIESLRFLFGEPRFISAIDPTKTDKKQFMIEDDKLVIPMENRLAQKRAAKECAAWISEKCEIKSMVKPNFLHGKMYHICASNGTEKAIVGSSNFTVNGLGMGSSPNIELNLEAKDDRDRQDLLAWFDELWYDDSGIVEDVKQEVLKYLAQLYANNSPQFIYYKTLYHLFEKYLAEQDASNLVTGKTGLFESEIWAKLYSFQKDGVKGAINKLERHNGCIIADSVGLGKTYEALAVIKHYEYRNKSVLVLCPKKLKNNWTVYQAHKPSVLNPFTKDRFNYTVAYHTDLGRTTGTSDADGIDLTTFNWAAYDLIVIDESHNLRGNPKEKKVEGDIVYNRAKFLMEKVLKAGGKTKVLMLSATPVNTTLKDLRNQIYYITEGEDAALKEATGIDSINYTIINAQKQFGDWVKRHVKGTRNTNDLMQNLDSSFFKLLDELTIARSRKHILSYYRNDPFGSFPTRLKPISQYSKIDLLDRFYSYDKISDEIQKYRLSLFNPHAFLKEEYKAAYGDYQMTLPFTQEDREIRLIGMMKVGFMKRLESSIAAFTLTMNRTLDKISTLIAKIDCFEKQNNPDESYEVPEDYDEEFGDEAEDFPEDWTVGKKLKYPLKHLDLKAWKEALSSDKDQLLSLYNAAHSVGAERDAKLQDLKELIAAKQKQFINADNKKVLVFTAFSDTAEYLYNNIKDWAKTELGLHSALVSGSSINKTTLKMPPRFQNDFNAILTCFAPYAKQRELLKILPQTEEIDIMIATDCISEGQNLQDCDYVINYDIHWNPVRIIQRFGRIDRLNSKNTSIQLLNFWPTKDLDKYIKLKVRVEARMALVDITATGEDNLFDDKQIEEFVSEELKFRHRQLKKLQHEVIDLEDMEEGISLTDFTLDDFRVDLLNYLKANEDELRNAPLGLYAVVPHPKHELWSSKQIVLPNQAEIIQPGVIFCLKHNEDGKDFEKLNPLHPYFLIYIRDDGTVRYHFTSAKQILEIYRILTNEKDKAIEALCDMFDAKTEHGNNMESYNALVQKAVEDIKYTLGKRSQDQLQQTRTATIPKRTSKTQFELITWLIIA